jgi:DNA modification methylase
MKFTEIQPNYSDHSNGIYLFQGDSVEILSKLEKDLTTECDAVITDPPYGISYRTNYRLTESILSKEIANDKDLSVVEVVSRKLVPLIKQNSALYFFGHSNMIGECRRLFDKDWTYKNTLIWDKGDSGTAGDLEAGYCLNYETILYYNKGRRVLNGSRPRAILRHMRESDEFRDSYSITPDEYLACIEHLIFSIPEESRDEVLKTIPQDIVSTAMREFPKAQIRQDWSSNNDPVHPNAKPQYLMERLIKNSTKEGDLIIDPFMGTSPVGAAAKRLKRRFIGIELEPEFFRIAQTRVEKTSVL